MAKKRRIPILKLRIQGPGVRSGGIRVPDLLLICEKAQSAINRQAEAVEGKLTLRPGRKMSKVHEECTLELVALKKGSTLLSFDIAKPQQHFPGFTSFGPRVASQVALTVDSLGRGSNSEQFDVGVLDSLKGLGEVFDRSGITSIEWIVPRVEGQRRIKATYTKEVRENIAKRLKAPTRQATTIEGFLEMVDFKESDLKCRIHPPIGYSVVCSFEHGLADRIYSALRSTVRVTGEASINPQTQKTESIRIINLESIDPLSVGGADFFTGRSIEELADTQNVKPIADLESLAGGWPQDQDLDDFLQEVYKYRESI